MTSVYLVSGERDEKGYPIVEKIALKGESKVPVGGRLKNGYLVGITRDGILLYDEDHPRPDKPQDPKEVNIAFWGGHTSPIVALFLNKEEAIECLNSSGLQNCDSRWRKQTEETLKAIGENHPVFILSKYSPISFE